jgi:hypothetical protein
LPIPPEEPIIAIFKSLLKFDKRLVYIEFTLFPITFIKL